MADEKWARLESRTNKLLASSEKVCSASTNLQTIQTYLSLMSSTFQECKDFVSGIMNQELKTNVQQMVEKIFDKQLELSELLSTATCHKGPASKVQIQAFDKLCWYHERFGKKARKCGETPTSRCPMSSVIAQDTRPRNFVTTINDTDPTQKQSMELFAEFPNLYDCSLGSVTSLTIPFRVETSTNPPVFQKVRPLHGKKREDVELELKKWLREGIIEPVSEEVHWASPIHAVPKGESWRVCGDFRLLNAATKTDKYPLPNLSSFNGKMSGCKFFSKIDLKRAYHQIPIIPEDQIKTTINTTLGLFKFKRIPFGLKNAGACFQRNINLILRDFAEFSYVYMDDVIVFSRTSRDHLHHLKLLFQCLSKHRILVNKDKCVFADKVVRFLGHDVSQEGITIPDDKMKTMLDFPVPKTKKELERFLGLFAFVHKFIKNASSIVSPLHDLRMAKTQADFNKRFSDQHLASFKKAKTAIAKSALLMHPIPDAPIELWTDASDFGIGSTLVQLHENVWRPISFWSKALNKAQRSYAAFDKELLAISYSIVHFREFVEAQRVVVRTDHKPLVSALEKKSDKFSPLQRRHLSFISQFVDSIQYRKGQENVVADTLSRLSDNNFDLPELGVYECQQIDQLPNPEDFLKAQQQDKQLQAWILKHRNCDSPFVPNLVPCAEMPDLKLWADSSTSPPKILVPTCYQKAVFNHFHNVAHFGYKACFALIKRTHYWPNFKKDIQAWSRECSSCQKNKVARHTSSFLQKLPDPSKRFSHIHVDIIGPFNRQDNNTSLFTIIDRWTFKNFINSQI